MPSRNDAREGVVGALDDARGDGVRASGKPANMVAPTDASYFQMLDRFIQGEVVDPTDHCMRGMTASLGIVKGQPFKPDDRQKKLLDAAAKVGWRMAKVIAFETLDKLPKAKWYPNRQWTRIPVVAVMTSTRVPPT